MNRLSKIAIVAAVVAMLIAPTRGLQWAAAGTGAVVGWLDAVTGCAGAAVPPPFCAKQAPGKMIHAPKISEIRKICPARNFVMEVLPFSNVHKWYPMRRSGAQLLHADYRLGN